MDHQLGLVFFNPDQDQNKKRQDGIFGETFGLAALG